MRYSVSVCMASFNGAPYVRAQVESILPQLGHDDELIVSDDGSTDGTVDILNAVRDPRLRILRGPSRGASANFAWALAHAQNEVVFLADQDDLWETEKIGRQCALLEHYVLVISDCVITDERGAVTHPSYFAVNDSHPGLIRNFYRNSYMGCCMAFRRELLRIALPIPSGLPHDWWLGMVAEVAGNVFFLPDRLVWYRRHGANTSLTTEKSRRGLYSRVRDRLRLACALIARAVKHAASDLGPVQSRL
jgi:glycosyltransferase involved in cell wall biosynthesis